MATGYLHSLCRQGNVAAVQTYLEGIEDISKLEKRVGFLGYTPLHEAISKGQTAVVRVLLLYGADANAKAHGCYAPLHIAAAMDNVECVVELLNYDADIMSKDEFGKTPYNTAVILNCKKSAQILKSEEIKKAARENSPNLSDMLASVTTQNVTPSCFKEAMLEASRYGHMDAICSLIIASGRRSLQLKDCISEALTFCFYKPAAMLLTCYAAKSDKRWLLKYLMSVEMSRQEEEQALSELPHDGVPHDVMERIRLFIDDKAVFPIAVPIGLALKQGKEDAVAIILMNTNCNQREKRIDWAKLALGEIHPVWLENTKWVEKLFLGSNRLTTVPSNISVLDKLSFLDLTRNKLKVIPEYLLEMPSLCDLRLSENKIVELPKKCKWSASLRSLYLNDNLLETLPKSMAKAKLSDLHLARNNLFEVPLFMDEISTLQSLDVSDNPRLIHISRKMEMLKVENMDQDGLSDLDKLYLAMAEVGTKSYFNILCYSLGVTSIV